MKLWRGNGRRTLALPPGAVLLVLSLFLVACSKEPIVLSPAFTPDRSAPRAGPLQGRSSIGMCRVHIADVRNARENPEFMGQMGPRPVIAADAVTWVRSALETMNAFPRLRLVGEGDEADLELRIELIKAYVMSYASAKASDVVVRVGYSRQGRKLDERVIRGTDNGTNWINGEGEMQSSLNGALASLVQQLDRDVIAHCDDASKTVSKAQ